MPRTGRIALSPMLNEAGKLIGDFTVAKAGEGRFLVWGSSAAQIYHLRWFEAHLPADGSVAVERLGMRLMGLMLAGPRSRDGAGGADRPRRVERGASASWTIGRWTWRACRRW